MKYFLVLLMFLEIFIDVTYAQIEPDTSSIFIKVNEIQLPNNIIIGSIASLDVYNKDLFVITDAISKKTLLFNKKKNTIKFLSTEKCTPGFKLYSLYSVFNRKGKIYVINERAEGYIFKRNGVCIGKLKKFFRVPHICFLSNNNIVAYSNIGDGNYLKLCDSKGVELERFGIFPESYKNAIMRVLGGGLVTDDRDFIYQVNVISPEIFVYKNKKLIRKISNYNHNFRMINYDINNPENPKLLVDYFMKLSKEYHMVTNLFLANSNTLLIQYLYKKKYFVQLVSTDGKKFLTNPIIRITPFIYAKDGFAYRTIQPEPINGVLPNPKIIVYKINYNN